MFSFFILFQTARIHPSPEETFLIRKISPVAAILYSFSFLFPFFLLPELTTFFEGWLDWHNPLYIGFSGHIPQFRGKS